MFVARGPAPGIPGGCRPSLCGMPPAAQGDRAAGTAKHPHYQAFRQVFGPSAPLPRRSRRSPDIARAPTRKTARMDAGACHIPVVILSQFHICVKYPSQFGGCRRPAEEVRGAHPAAGTIPRQRRASSRASRRGTPMRMPRPGCCPAPDPGMAPLPRQGSARAARAASGRADCPDPAPRSGRRGCLDAFGGGSSIRADGVIAVPSYPLWCPCGGWRSMLNEPFTKCCFETVHSGASPEGRPCELRAPSPYGPTGPASLRPPSASSCVPRGSLRAPFFVCAPLRISRDRLLCPSARFRLPVCVPRAPCAPPLIPCASRPCPCPDFISPLVRASRILPRAASRFRARTGYPPAFRRFVRPGPPSPAPAASGRRALTARCIHIHIVCIYLHSRPCIFMARVL